MALGGGGGGSGIGGTCRIPGAGGSEGDSAAPWEGGGRGPGTDLLPHQELGSLDCIIGVVLDLVHPHLLQLGDVGVVLRVGVQDQAPGGAPP